MVISNHLRCLFVEFELEVRLSQINLCKFRSRLHLFQQEIQRWQRERGSLELRVDCIGIIGTDPNYVALFHSYYRRSPL